MRVEVSSYDRSRVSGLKVFDAIAGCSPACVRFASSGNAPSRLRGIEEKRSPHPVAIGFRSASAGP